MNIESRKSIHREDRKTKTNTEKSTASPRETRKTHLDANKRTPIRGEESVADKFAGIHASQENLCEEILHETEYAGSTSFGHKTRNNNIESLQSSSRLRRNKPDPPPVTTKSVNQSKLKNKSQETTEQVHGCNCLFVCVVVTAFICFGLGYMLYISDFQSQQLGHHCSFSDLKEKYPDQNSTLWKCMEFGLDGILNERFNKPSVTLFVHKGSKGANELIRDIATTASNCMDSSLEPVEFRSSDFTSDEAAVDYGVVIDKYKKTAKEGNVVMITNLNEIPADAARALHAICDRESPIFRKVVILLSLTSDHNGGRPIDIAEDALYNLWEGKILENELGPLIARVTDEVILLQSK